MTDQQAPQTMRALAAKWRKEAFDYSGIYAPGGEHTSIEFNGQIEKLQACAAQLDALADALGARLEPPHSEDEKLSYRESRNSGDIAKAESWSMEDWIRRELIGEKP